MDLCLTDVCLVNTLCVIQEHRVGCGCFFVIVGVKKGFDVDGLGGFDPNICLGTGIRFVCFEYQRVPSAGNSDNPKVSRSIACCGTVQSFFKSWDVYGRSLDGAVVLVKNISPHRAMISGKNVNACPKIKYEDYYRTTTYCLGQITIYMTILSLL